MARMARVVQKFYGKVPPLSKDISGSAWGVWAALCLYAKWETQNGQPVRSKPGSCFPKLEVIASAAHVSSRTAIYALRELEKARYVQTVARYGRRSRGAKGEQRSNGYELFPNGDAPIRAEDAMSREDFVLGAREMIRRLTEGKTPSSEKP